MKNLTVKEYLELTNQNEIIDSVGLYYDSEEHRNGHVGNKEATIDSHLTMTSLLKYLDLEVTSVDLSVIERDDKTQRIRANIYVKE